MYIPVEVHLRTKIEKPNNLKTTLNVRSIKSHRFGEYREINRPVPDTVSDTCGSYYH